MNHNQLPHWSLCCCSFSALCLNPVRKRESVPELSAALHTDSSRGARQGKTTTHEIQFPQRKASHIKTGSAVHFSLRSLSSGSLFFFFLFSFSTPPHPTPPAFSSEHNVVRSELTLFGIWVFSLKVVRTLSEDGPVLLSLSGIARRYVHLPTADAVSHLVTLKEFNCMLT